MMTAMVAGVRCSAQNMMMSAIHFALVTSGNPAGKTLLLDVFQAGLIVREFPVEISQRVLR
jgi:hypothetical protein